jgi:predicted dehydrogenase
LILGRHENVNHNQIRVGIAGLGRSGWDIHAHLLAGLGEHYQVVAVVDADEGRRQQAIDRFGCRAYANSDDLLADDAVELVVVALPSHRHADYSIAALEAGKHVVCEKPMAPTLAEADRMVAAAEQSDTVLSIFQNRRYNPDFVKIRALIDSGILGRIVLIKITESRFSRRWDWQTLKKYGGGALNNTGAHHLDMALQLFGAGYPEVFAHLERTLSLGDADDHVKIILRGENHPMIDIEISSADAYPPENWHILGTQGGLAGTTRELRWKYFDPATLPDRTLDTRPTPDRSYNRDEIPWQEGCWTIDEYDGPGYAGFYLDLYETIRNGAPLVITPQSVRRVIWVQEECHRQSGL